MTPSSTGWDDHAVGLVGDRRQGRADSAWLPSLCLWNAGGSAVLMGHTGEGGVTSEFYADAQKG